MKKKKKKKIMDKFELRSQSNGNTTKIGSQVDKYMSKCPWKK